MKPQSTTITPLPRPAVTEGNKKRESKILDRGAREMNQPRHYIISNNYVVGLCRELEANTALICDGVRIPVQSETGVLMTEFVSN